MPMTVEEAKQNMACIRGLRASKRALTARVLHLEQVLRNAGNENGQPIAAYMEDGLQVKYHILRAQRVHDIIAKGLRK